MATEYISDTEQLKTYITELYNLRNIYNNSLLGLAKKYGTGYGEVPFITNEWRIYTGKMNNYDIFQYISRGIFTYTTKNIDSMLNIELCVDKTNYIYQMVNNQLRH